MKATLEPGEASLDRDVHEHISKARIRHYIARSLGDPGLSPARICRDVGISRASLYRLFEPEGGVANYILARRLEQASKRIRDPGEVRNLSQIALSLGFRSGSELSRSFKRMFEVTPSDLRTLCSGDQGMAIENIDFSLLLHRLA
jgi:AraC-like DNA-binding protein